MKFLSNPEIKKFIAVIMFSLISVSFVLAFVSLFSACCVFITGLCLLCAFVCFTKLRYKRINKLEKIVDRILHGDISVNISSYGEGELSLLETEVQKVLMMLRQQNDILQRDRRFLADSIADISHQLRTPLTSINLVISLLQADDLTDDRREELMHDLTLSLSRTDYLISALLKVSKLDAGIVSYDFRQVSLTKVMKKATEPFLIALEIKSIDFDMICDESIIECDIDWCAEAFSNIIKNCIEHTPEGGRISVTSKDTPILTEVIIRDSGSGFIEEDIPHLFDRFYKGKTSSDESFGIGLNLARIIFEGHNGMITACNSESGGAEFIIKFYKQIV